MLRLLLGGKALERPVRKRRGCRVKFPPDADLWSVLHFHHYGLISGLGEGEVVPTSVPRGNFTLE